MSFVMEKGEDTEGKEENINILKHYEHFFFGKTS